MAKDDVLHVRIEAAVKAALQVAAAKDGRTMASLVNKVLADWLKTQKGKKP